MDVRRTALDTRVERERNEFRFALFSILGSGSVASFMSICGSSTVISVLTDHTPDHPEVLPSSLKTLLYTRTQCCSYVHNTFELAIDNVKRVTD